MDRLFGWVVGWMIAAVFFLWVWTRDHVDRALAPRYRYTIRDHAIERIEGWRSRLALAAYLGTYLVWAPDRLSDGSVLNQMFEGVFNTALQVVYALAIAWALLVLFAREARLTVARHAALPLGAGVGTLVAIGTSVWAITLLTRADNQTVSGGGAIVVLLARLTVLLVGLIVATSATWYTLQHASGGYFRAIDGHPTMRAIVTLLLAARLGFRGAQTWVEDGLPDGFPLPVAVALLLLTPSLLIGIAGVELRRLATSGITVRTLVLPRVAKAP